MIRLVKNIKIIGPNKIIEGQSLIIEKGYIKALTSEINREKFEDVVDGEGMYLAPGFIDIQDRKSVV